MALIQRTLEEEHVLIMVELIETFHHIQTLGHLHTIETMALALTVQHLVIHWAMDQV